MAKIVLSYRRDDSLTITSWLYEKLVDRYGKESIFRDIDSIQPTENFRKRIGRALRDCDFVVAIVGPGWRGVGADGHARIQSANDWVRVEIETALQLDIPLLPVLVEGAEMPQPDELPASLREITEINALPVSSDTHRFYDDLGRLFAAIDKVTGGPADDDAAVAAAPIPQPVPQEVLPSDMAAPPAEPRTAAVTAPAAAADPPAAPAAPRPPVPPAAAASGAAAASRPAATVPSGGLINGRTALRYVILPGILMSAYWFTAMTMDVFRGDAEFLLFVIPAVGMMVLGASMRQPGGLSPLDAVIAGAVIGLAASLCVIVSGEINPKTESGLVLAILVGGGVGSALAGYFLVGVVIPRKGDPA